MCRQQADYKKKNTKSASTLQTVAKSAGLIFLPPLCFYALFYYSHTVRRKDSLMCFCFATALLKTPLRYGS